MDGVGSAQQGRHLIPLIPPSYLRMEMFVGNRAGRESD